MFEVTLSQALGVTGKKETDYLASTKLSRVRFHIILQHIVHMGHGNTEMAGILVFFNQEHN